MCGTFGDSPKFRKWRKLSSVKLLRADSQVSADVYDELTGSFSRVEVLISSKKCLYDSCAVLKSFFSEILGQVYCIDCADCGADFHRRNSKVFSTDSRI